jgi:hypothetical protein
MSLLTFTVKLIRNVNRQAIHDCLRIITLFHNDVLLLDIAT